MRFVYFFILLFSLALITAPTDAFAALASTTRATVTGADNANGGDLTTSSFTPSNNSLLVAVYGGVIEEDVAADTTAAMAGGSLVWTKRATVNQIESGAGWRTWVTVWTAPVTTGASMTVSGTNDGNMNGTFLSVYEYTGYDTGNPVRATGTGSREATQGSWNFSLSASPAASSEVVAALAVNNWIDTEGGAVTPGTGWAEFSDFPDVSTETRGQVQGRGNSTSGTVLWNEADCDSGGGGGVCAGAVVEIKAASTRIGLVKPPNNLGLVGYWSLNEATSTVATDFSGNGFHGSFSGNAVTWTSGKRGSAVQFGGSSDYISTSDLNNTTDSVGELTISLWLYNTTLAAGTGVFGKWSVASPNWVLYTSDTIDCGSNDMAFAPDGNDGECTSGNVHAANTWEHWVIVYDGGQASDDDDIKMYLNGVLQADQRFAGNDPIPDTTAANSNVVTIGDTSDGASGFTGIIDEVRVYNRALGPTEAANLFWAGGGAARVGASTKTLSETSTLNTGLVGHWTFDGIDFTSFIRDVSSNSNNAYVFGVSTSSVKTRGKFGQAVNFVESAYYLYAPDNASLNFGSSQDFSASLWIKARGIDGTYAGLMGDKLSRATNRLGYLLSYMNSGGVGVYISDGVDEVSIFSTALVSDGEWHHVALTASRTGNAILYVDGVVEGTPASLSAVGSLDEPGSPVFIGDIGFQGQPFDGVLDDVHIYNRVLTAAEVRQLSTLGQARIQQ